MIRSRGDSTGSASRFAVITGHIPHQTSRRARRMSIVGVLERHIRECSTIERNPFHLTHLLLVGNICGCDRSVTYTASTRKCRTNSFLKESPPHAYHWIPQHRPPTVGRRRAPRRR